MKSYIAKLSPEDRKTWRQWQAGWFCFYAVVVMALLGIGTFLPGNTELAQSTPTDFKAMKTPPAISAQLKQR
jgi:hypothetical protein